MINSNQCSNQLVDFSYKLYFFRGYLGPGGLSENGIHDGCTGGAAAYIDKKIFSLNHIYNYPTCTVSIPYHQLSYVFFSSQTLIEFIFQPNFIFQLLSVKIFQKVCLLKVHKKCMFVCIPMLRISNLSRPLLEFPGFCFCYETPLEFTLFPINF